ncbi:MAG TPA: DUF3857 domain-containing protein [Silvibacterium sp.]|nr:DUF3857 domain-containing protein [Silvibacterium sp.]
MKTYAAAPDAPAVYLFREETVDDNIHIHTLYARIKILSDKGKEMFGDIEIPYEAGYANIRGVTGRTIHIDGTVIPFTGKPEDKLLIRAGKERVMAKVFSMPDVQVGSIVEYRWVLGYNDDYLAAPYWVVQQKVPVLKAHYHFAVTSSIGGNLRFVVSHEFGHEIAANQLLYTYILPPGDKVVQQADGTYDVTAENIPAAPSEDFLPPFGSLTYRVVFYYSPFRTPTEFWKTDGKYWSSDFDRFANPSGKIRAAVNGIIAPGDSDQVKVEKIYAAIMKIDNTSFSRQHTAEENKAEGLKVKNAEDIWAQQRGSDDQITRLFVAMVRAAGLKAYGAVVVNRDQSIFVQSYLTWSQLDDELAIVNIGGKEVYFDPGQRYCEFAKLNWKHTWAGGIRQSGDGAKIFTTPGLDYKDNSLKRSAQLTLDPDGHVHGLIYENMTGSEALQWRQAALRGDEAGVKKDFEDALQRTMPPGVQVKTNHFVGLTDYNTPLMAIVNVSGTLGTQTGKHIFLPAVFFEAGNPPLFAKTQRENPVDMHFPYMVQDDFHLTLPPNFTIDSLPTGGDVPFSPFADCIDKFVSEGNTLAYGRLLRVANVEYKTTEYPSLREFFQKVSASDQAQVALKISPVAVTASAVPPAPAK